MGGFWSKDDEVSGYWSQDDEVSGYWAKEGEVQPSCKFGEFLCSHCGRAWKSHLAWSGKFQRCNRCRRAVYPHTLRDRCPSDIPRRTGAQEHSREMCQMCNELGSYCGDFKKKS